VSADPCYTYKPQELCAWKVAPGTFWFQTTDPRYSRKLDQRQDTRRGNWRQSLPTYLRDARQLAES